MCLPKIPEMKKNFNVEKISVMKPDLSNDITGKSSFPQSLEAGESGSRFLVLEGKPLCAHCQHVFSDLKKDTRRNLTHPRNYSPGAREAALLSRETKTPLPDKLQLLPAQSALRRPGKSCPWEAWRAATIQKKRSQQAKMGMAPYFIPHKLDKGGKHPILYSVALYIA